MLRSTVVLGVSSIFKNVGRCPPVLIQTLGSRTSLPGQRFSSLSIHQCLPPLSLNLPALTHQPSRGYAARKGTRARRAAKKTKKVVEEKKSFMTRKFLLMEETVFKKQRPFDDSHYPSPVDDVYLLRKFKTKEYPFEEAVQNMREVHHPTVYNVPNAPLYLRVNIDLRYPNRPNKFMDGFRSIIEMKSPFLIEGMVRPSILAFCLEDVDYIDNVLKEGGVEMAGGKELIKAIQAGEVNPDEFEYLIAHPSIVPDLSVIRGLIKKKFPTIRAKTISTDLVAEAKRLKSGVKIHVIKNDREPDFGYIEIPIGTLDMEGLHDNFKSILADIVPRRVSNKVPSDFIVSCVLKTPGNGFEEFKVDLTGILDEVAVRQKPVAVEELE